MSKKPLTSQVHFFDGNTKQVKEAVQSWLNQLGGTNIEIEAVGQSQQNDHMCISIFYRYLNK
jgi:hypothetical protein